MTKPLLLVPLCTGVAQTSLSLGLVHALQRQGIRVGFGKLMPAERVDKDRTLAIMAKLVESPAALVIVHQAPLASLTKQLTALTETSPLPLIIAGLPAIDGGANPLNLELANALGLDVLLLGNGAPASKLLPRIEKVLTQLSSSQVQGLVLNQWPADNSDGPISKLGQGSQSKPEDTLASALPVPLWATIPWVPRLLAPRIEDVARHLGALPLCSGDWSTRRVKEVILESRSLTNMATLFKPGALLVTSGDRSDLIVAAALATRNGLQLGGLLLTGGYQPEPAIMDLCEGAFDDGLPMLLVEDDTWHTSQALQALSLHLEVDDSNRQRWIMEWIADHLDTEALLRRHLGEEKRLSPTAFRYQLMQKARRQRQRVLLPEGEDARVVEAAVKAAQLGIAQCLLLGNPARIRAVAQSHDVQLGHDVVIIDPDSIRERYVAPMMKLRQHKGLEEVMAREQLQDNNVLGAMMLAQDEADAMVSGAQGTTLSTLRPALQLIKTAPGQSLVSSAFLLLLPDQVLIYGDCAINPSPNAQQLAEIALQCADTAALFDLTPQVAMISTTSSQPKVQQATAQARAQAPRLVIEGPLAYDTAIIESLARAKAPGSPIAGRSNVFIFPELNLGYSTFQTVRRSAELVTLGPMVQGLKKPVNDLSRDASIHDIVQTIALTAVQAANPGIKKAAT
ncbi:phosphate acetyltransferase [Gallaecimonas pentaromativorans]|uniref:phosphate acetyltransferase n=1 Tax=Gallaecimonas pentaromativorans TaxID=584787 RepID=UPI003A916BB4